MANECVSTVAATHQVTFRGAFQKRWASMFGNVTVLDTHVDGGGRITTISVRLADEAALMGLLTHLYEQGNLLVSVRTVSTQAM